MDEVIAPLKAILIYDCELQKPLLAKYYWTDAARNASLSPSAYLFSTAPSRDRFESLFAQHVRTSTHDDDLRLFTIDMSSTFTDAGGQRNTSVRGEEFVVLVQARPIGKILVAVASVANSFSADLMADALVQGLADALQELARTSSRTISLSLSSSNSSMPSSTATVDRSFCMEHYDWLALLVDESCEAGVIVEVDAKELVRRVRCEDTTNASASSEKRQSTAQSLFGTLKSALMRPS